MCFYTLQKLIFFNLKMFGRESYLWTRKIRHGTRKNDFGRDKCNSAQSKRGLFKRKHKNDN